MLASQGFVTLALAFFGVDDLPEVYSSFDMEYFEEAVDYLLARTEVTSEKVGLCGSSTGGNIALCMMMFFGHKIQACAVFSCPFVSAPGPTFYKGNCVEASDFHSETVLRIKGGPSEIERYFSNNIQYVDSTYFIGIPKDR